MPESRKMGHINSYPSVMQIGHKMIADIFKSPVLVEEKIDGSQFSFGIIDGELSCHSKGKQQLIDAPDDMFQKAVNVIKTLPLQKGWMYRGEFLAKPKHNTLSYARTPKNNIILFDINSGLEEYLSPRDKLLEAERIGLECVPKMFEGLVEDFEMFKSFLDKESTLGGCKVEGVVVKNYSIFTSEKKAAMGKYVSEDFKEKHDGDWKGRNLNKSDLEFLLIEEYKTEARWRKALEHLRDDGKLEGSPRDIALFMKEVPVDILKECEQEIKDKLFKHFWPKISRGVIRGLPEWYKDYLAKGAFEEGKDGLLR
jgi:RNA ligase